MTKEIWEEYKDQKDAEGVTFKTCVFSGIKNLDSGIGLYAGCQESYDRWNKLFDRSFLTTIRASPRKPVTSLT
jgi:creatine kinase/arginine kinase